MSTPNVRTKRNVAKALRRHTRSTQAWVRWNKITSKMRAYDANAFLMGVMLDRGGLAERAWDAAEHFCSSVGDTDDVSSLWSEILAMDRPRLRGYLRYGYGGKAFHRFYKTFAKLLPQAAEHLLENYGGDPRQIWNNQRDIAKVKQRLDDIPAIGPGLANMAVLILARQHGLLGGKTARRQLDPKPDIQVRRVFTRTGLIPKGATDEAIIDIARELSPDFPAALDAPAWDIGQQWCKPSRPLCTECPLGTVCQRVGINSR